jgi:SEC-C motif-containing protein
MRSRYSAFAVGNPAYLRDTWDTATRPEEIELDDDTTWTSLEILNTVRGGPFDVEGIVEFRARYRSAQGRGERHERSTFAKKAGRWVYLTSDTYPV